jgi:peroxiredoxin
MANSSPPVSAAPGPLLASTFDNPMTPDCSGSRTTASTSWAAANYPKIAVAYTQIVTISTDNILETNEFRDSVGAQWTFLSDAGRHVQKDLDIQEYTDPTTTR